MIRQDPSADPDTRIQSVGAAKIPSVLKDLDSTRRYHRFVSDEDRILGRITLASLRECQAAGKMPLSFEEAGPREYIYFDPRKAKAAIVTCGGLCPGVNDVIRAIVLALHYIYGVRNILGIKYGLQGFIAEYGHEVVELTPETVANIHELGGTVLGTSRGPQDIAAVVDAIERLNISMLFAIGGDGTLRAAARICEEIGSRGLKVVAVGIPKTIDNDINLVARSFGFDTAVEMAAAAIRSAHTEAVGAHNGIGLVKVMGRHSGFIAATAALAQKDCNLVLIPEVDFDLDGPQGLLAFLQERLKRRGHAVILVAEGAGQKFFDPAELGRDPSGNVRLGDIGAFLKSRIQKYLQGTGMDSTLKYIDPSYLIRSVPANANDDVFCGFLGQNAVHAAMAGKTAMVVSLWNNRYVHVPISLVIAQRKQVDPNGRLWLSVVESTGQPSLRNTG
jgi:6-phosphofructokinase 1